MRPNIQRAICTPSTCTFYDYSNRSNSGYHQLGSELLEDRPTSLTLLPAAWPMHVLRESKGCTQGEASSRLMCREAARQSSRVHASGLLGKQKALLQESLQVPTHMGTCSPHTRFPEAWWASCVARAQLWRAVVEQEARPAPALQGRPAPMLPRGLQTRRFHTNR